MPHRRSSQGRAKQTVHKRVRIEVAPKILTGLIAADRRSVASWKKGAASHEHPKKRNKRRRWSFDNSSSSGDPRGKMVPMTPPDPPPLDRLGFFPRRSVLKWGLQDPATAQSSSSSSSAQRIRFQCPSPPVEVRSYKKLMKDHLQFDGVTVCDGRYCRHSVLAGAGEGLYPWDEDGEPLSNHNRYEVFCDECRRDMDQRLGLSDGYAYVCNFDGNH